VLPNITVFSILAIALGAIPGALCRYYITLWSQQVFGNKFPYGTFLINITGCTIMGFFINLISGISDFPTEVRLMVTTGFLGSYTTFSTYSFETRKMWQSGNISKTLFYWAGSAIFGVLGVQLGADLAQLIAQ